jgi:chromosomal replication initiation ATPase DnaA
VICQLVGQRFNVSVEQILSPARSQPTTQARHIAMRLVREFTDLSFPEIGARFNRNHSTVIHALEVTAGTLLNDLREEIAAALGVEQAPPQSASDRASRLLPRGARR